jgi:predicted O-methyltransferase YrrM
MESSVLTLVAAIVAVLALAACVHQVRRLSVRLATLEANLKRALDDQFRQAEALCGLYVELGLDKSLPASRGWAASPDFLAELVRHASAARPRVIVECGSGLSTVILARWAQRDGTGHVYSLEHAAEFAERTRAELARLHLSEWATVCHAPLAPFRRDGVESPWYTPDSLPGNVAIDLLVVDGPPATVGPVARYPAGPLLFDKLAPNGVVFVDDADRAPEREAIARWQAERPTLACRFIPSEKGCARLWFESPSECRVLR